ncbi:MAG: selenocysteine-specific translation elongation factor [Planctomycetes bacterium]|nr:selenocysteine-specific translation elongation factor [Planctomycetota bacterium]
MNAPVVLRAVLGTAGHIDHGKSTLVKALTGTDPDRFPEEKDRGMTIDIGYAEYRTADGVDVGLIDVPGHERFVRNMVAGASGMDLVMLVVAADDGVMPQTREHLEIMTLLGLKRGFVCLTKVDKAPPDLTELVEEDLREFLAGTFLEGAPILRICALTGLGMDTLRATIDTMVRDLPAHDDSGVFRMPVQRSFTVKGHGTVVTGVPVSGRVVLGDALELLPAGLPCRVRGIQVHHRPAEQGGAGQRTALNLADVEYRAVERGAVLTTPGYFSATRLLEARFRLLSTAAPMRDALPVRFHAGCVEVMGTMVLLDTRELQPGEDALVQLRLEEPVVIAPGDHYLVRLASPERTLGGGLVLGETRFRFKRFKEWIHENLEGKEQSLADRGRYLEYVVRSEGLHPVPIERLPLLLKDSPAAVAKDIASLLAAGVLVQLPARKELLHRDMVARGAEAALKALVELHTADHYPFGFGVQPCASRMKHPPHAVSLFLQRLVDDGAVQKQGEQFRAKSFTGGLSHEDRRLCAELEKLLESTGFAAPIPQDIAEQLQTPRKRVDNILKLLSGRGLVVELDENVFVHFKSVKEARDKLVAYCQQHGSMPSNQMKDVINATRKYVIPLLEHFDKIGLTVRRESSRSLKPGWERVLADS